jgi:sialate O-acetylesterase
MHSRYSPLFMVVSIALLNLPAPISAAEAPGETALPFLSPMFGDHMLMQRGKANTFWGWATPGKAISVEIGDKSVSTTVGADGKWEVKIDPPAAGGPYEVKISGPANNVVLHDVLVGDVWLCGGQSNMELGLSVVENGRDEVKAADHPEIRLFMVHSHVAYSPAKVPQGEWKVCSPKSVSEGGSGGFSAVGYFFGRKLHDTLHVPIGLVQDCVGGTPAETWTSTESLQKLGGFDAQIAEMDRLRKLGGPEYGNYIMHWYDQYDVGQKGTPWFANDFDYSSWKPVQIPGGFAELGVPGTPAVCWFRREVTLPDSLPAGVSTLHLGSIEQMDTAWVNGKWVGASAWVENPRVYFLQKGVLRPGKNEITLRVFKVKKDGGFLSKADVFQLVLADKTAIPLAGEWKGAMSVDARPPHPMPLSFENWPTMPAVLYQGMLQPVAPLAITGAIWYQGEANQTHASKYQSILTAMIGDWRQLLEQGDFPFYIVSLPAFMAHRDQPGGSDGWTEVREAQIQTARSVPNSGVAITVDTGESNNIHPRAKKVVGERLALVALAKTYGQDLVYQGPTLKSVEPMPGAIRVRFDHADGGLVAKDGEAKEFSVAGTDHKWHWAEAKIDGDSVVVSSPEVPEPVNVRYAWESNPRATLYNGAGLPAEPFRTDK